MVLERNCVSTAWIIMNEVPYRQVCLWISNGYSWYCAQSRVKIHKWILSEQTNRNDAKGSWGGFLCHPLVFPVRQSLTSSSGWEAGHWKRGSGVNYECESSIWTKTTITPQPPPPPLLRHFSALLLPDSVCSSWNTGVTLKKIINNVLHQGINK